MNQLERHLRRAYAPGRDFDAQTDSFTEALFTRAERAQFLAALAWLRDRATSRAESLARVLPRSHGDRPPAKVAELVETCHHSGAPHVPGRSGSLVGLARVSMAGGP